MSAHFKKDNGNGSAPQPVVTKQASASTKSASSSHVAIPKVHILLSIIEQTSSLWFCFSFGSLIWLFCIIFTVWCSNRHLLMGSRRIWSINTYPSRWKYYRKAYWLDVEGWQNAGIWALLQCNKYYMCATYISADRLIYVAILLPNIRLPRSICSCYYLRNRWR